MIALAERVRNLHLSKIKTNELNVHTVCMSMLLTDAQQSLRIKLETNKTFTVVAPSSINTFLMATAIFNQTLIHIYINKNS